MEVIQLGLYLFNHGLYEDALRELEHPSAITRYGATLPSPSEWPRAYIKLERYEDAEVVLLNFSRVVDAQRQLVGDDVLKTRLMHAQVTAASGVYVYLESIGKIKYPQAAPPWLVRL